MTLCGCRWKPRLGNTGLSFLTLHWTHAGRSLPCLGPNTSPENGRLNPRAARELQILVSQSEVEEKEEFKDARPAVGLCQNLFFM